MICISQRRLPTSGRRSGRPNRVYSNDVRMCSIFFVLFTFRSTQYIHVCCIPQSIHLSGIALYILEYTGYVIKLLMLYHYDGANASVSWTENCQNRACSDALVACFGLGAILCDCGWKYSPRTLLSERPT